jgi:16S rRNA (guanine527-N7)-methyltransferase
MNKDEFYSELKLLNIDLTDLKKEQLNNFCNLLLEYNKNTNLTAIKTEEEVYLKHFYDSLTLIKVINITNDLTILDIGSGAGFPGIVLKIVFPLLNVILLDSNHKKTEFQNYIISKLNLKNIQTINQRAELYYSQNTKFDIVVARAVADLSILSELCLPFVKINGSFIAMKGNIEEELSSSLYSINLMGGEISEQVSFNLPIENSSRNLIKIKKIKDSPEGYPRSYDKILKKPLKKNQK